MIFLGQILISFHVCYTHIQRFGNKTCFLASKWDCKLWSLIYLTHTTAGDTSKVDLLKSFPNAENNLVLFQADIYNPTEFEPAIEGCKYVFHVATPLVHDTQSSKVCSLLNHILLIIS